MSDPVLFYQLELAGKTYDATRVRGSERMNAPFRFEVVLVLEPGDPLEPNAVVRTDAKLILHRENRGPEREQAGIVTSITRKATRRGFAGGCEVHVVVEPKLSLLAYRTDIRIFRNKTAHQSAKEVLEGLGVTVEERLSSSYRVRPYTVQFRETDLDFAHRMLEDDGIHYFIGENDTVVFGDAVGSYDPNVGLLPFRHGSGLTPMTNPIIEIGARGTMTAGKVTLRDFNPVHPRMNMDVAAAGPTQGGAEYYDYPGEYEEPPEGSEKANLRAEALRCAHHRIAGRSFSGQLRPGVTFETVNTPGEAYDGEFVVTKVDHDWNRDRGGYSIAFESLPGSVVYRPMVVSPAPLQKNPLTGFVTGPAGSDIHTNEWGQVKVHFPLGSGPTERRQRVTLDPDPARQHRALFRHRPNELGGALPLHGGRSRSSHRPRPRLQRARYVCEPAPRAKDAILAPLSLVSPRGESEEYAGELHPARRSARLRGDHGPRPKRSERRREERQAGADRRHGVARDRRQRDDLDWRRSRDSATKQHLSPDVTGNQIRNIAGNHTLRVGSSMTESVAKNLTESIGGSETRNLGKMDSLQVASNTKETVGGVDLELSLKGNSDQAEKTRALLVGGAIIEIAKNSKVEQSGLGRVETIGGIAYAKAGATMGTDVSNSRKTNVGGLLRIESVKEMLVAGLKELKQKALASTYEGTKTLTFKVGSTQIAMKDGVIELKADSSIVIKTNAENKQGSKSAKQI